MGVCGDYVPTRPTFRYALILYVCWQLECCLVNHELLKHFHPSIFKIGHNHQCTQIPTVCLVGDSSIQCWVIWEPTKQVTSSQHYAPIYTLITWLSTTLDGIHLFVLERILSIAPTHSDLSTTNSHKHNKKNLTDNQYWSDIGVCVCIGVSIYIYFSLSVVMDAKSPNHVVLHVCFATSIHNWNS